MILGHTIPKALKMVPVAMLIGAQHNYKTSIGFSSLANTCITSHNYHHTLRKSDNNQCMHSSEEPYNGRLAFMLNMFIIILKYRNYYYYYMLDQKC